MTVAQSRRISKYHPTVPTSEFDIGWPIFEVDELIVEINGVENTSYSITGTFVDGRSDNAVLVLDDGVSDVSVVIVGSRPPRVDVDLGGASPRLAERTQIAIDRLSVVIQEMSARQGISPRLPYSADLSDVLFPVPSPGRSLIARADGLGWEDGPLAQTAADSDAAVAAAEEAARYAEAAAEAVRLLAAFVMSSGLAIVGEFVKMLIDLLALEYCLLKTSLLQKMFVLRINMMRDSADFR